MLAISVSPLRRRYLYALAVQEYVGGGAHRTPRKLGTTHPQVLSNLVQPRTKFGCDADDHHGI
ncbi:hypothetical protein [uncultured Paludibaculum sp.]|uniref:hypothetical protein n=1 Tax=uncultured Paludibaculum sp. TaxID=1765020 RepID=UPI002AAC09FB|nr:hypothetical protein [uncultured Paludibaculum sp.]